MKKDNKSVLIKIEKHLSNFFKNIFDNNKKTIIFITIISLFSCLFLLTKGIILGHDLKYHLSRILAISNNLRQGDFKSLIHDGFFGYGYANGLFYSNLFLYFPAILKFIGLDVITSYKLFILVCSILTTYSMYFLVKKITKNNKISAISAIIYTLCSYRICDVMVRAAIGETLAFIFIPIVILGLYEIIFGDYKKFYIFSIGFVGLINSHLLSTVLVFIISVIVIFVYILKIFEQPKRFLYLVYSVIFGMLLGAFFIFPMLEQYFRADLLINSQQNDIASVMPFLKLFFGIPNFKSRFIPGGIGLIFVFAIIKRFSIKEKDKMMEFSDFCMIIGILSLLASSDLLPWLELSKVLGSIQFTWRLLFVSSAFLSISAAIILYKVYMNDKYKSIKLVFLLIYIVSVCLINQFLSYYSLKTYYRDEKVPFLTTYNDFSIASGEYLPAKTDWSLIYTDKRIIKTNNSEINVKFKEKNGKMYVYYSNNNTIDTYIDVPLIYYLGYCAKSIDTNYYYDLEYGYNTWIRIYLKEKEKDTIVVWYKGTRVERLSCIVSTLTLIFSIFYLINLNKKRKVK